MLALHDIYALPQTSMDLIEDRPSAQWFKEVSDWPEGASDEVMAQVQAEGRMQVREVGHQRHAALRTLWFDGEPVGIFHEAYREDGDDYTNVKRWITDAVRFLQVCEYLRNKMVITIGADELDDVYAPNTQMYEEDILHVNNHDFGKDLGYPTEPRHKGYTLYHNVERLIPGANPAHYMVTGLTKIAAFPEYLRRNGVVLKQVGALTQEELSLNPRVEEVSGLHGHTQFYWYLRVERPDDAVVVSM